LKKEIAKALLNKHTFNFSNMQCGYSSSDSVDKWTKLIAYSLEKTIFETDTTKMAELGQFINFVQSLGHKINYTKLFIEVACVTKSDWFASNFLTTFLKEIDIESTSTNSSKMTPSMFIARAGLLETTKMLVETCMCDLTYKDVENRTVAGHASVSQIVSKYLTDYNKSLQHDKRKILQENAQLKQDFQQLKDQFSEMTELFKQLQIPLVSDDRKHKQPKLCSDSDGYTDEMTA